MIEDPHLQKRRSGSIQPRLYISYGTHTSLMGMGQKPRLFHTLIHMNRAIIQWVAQQPYGRSRNRDIK